MNQKCPECGQFLPLTKDQVQAAYAGLKEGLSANEIAKLLGKSTQLIYQIKHRKFKPEWTAGL